VECGHEGYVCRDPKSDHCEKSLNPKCANDQRTKAPLPTCADGTTLYRMVMYDSFGDGWDGTQLTIADTASLNTFLYTLELKDGSQGTEYICLSRSPTCYRVEVKGGVWGREVSWEVKPLTEGAPALASGGSPMSCDFGVAGNSCTNTCTGRPTEDPTKDPDYKQFKTMSQCINEKCPIQIGACESDKVCIDCFRDVSCACGVIASVHSCFTILSDFFHFVACAFYAIRSRRTTVTQMIISTPSSTVPSANAPTLSARITANKRWHQACPSILTTTTICGPRILVRPLRLSREEMPF
jgi:hypothetical protein